MELILPNKTPGQGFNLVNEAICMKAQTFNLGVGGGVVKGRGPLGLWNPYTIADFVQPQLYFLYPRPECYSRGHLSIQDLNGLKNTPPPPPLAAHTFLRLSAPVANVWVHPRNCSNPSPDIECLR